MIFLKALLMLAWARAALLTVPFKRLVVLLEHHKGVVLPPSLAYNQLRQATRIGYLVSAAARCTPWRSPCLSQVLVVQRLLGKRGIPGQLYLGVRRGCDRTGDPAGLSAHAWLQCGDVIVSGAAEHEEFTVVSTFRWGLTPPLDTVRGSLIRPAGSSIQDGSEESD